MEVSGDPVLATGERRKFRRTCSGLGRTGGGCGRYFRSRVTYYRTGEDTLRISVARARSAARGARKGSRARGARSAPFESSSLAGYRRSRARREEQSPPCAFPFLFDDRTHTCVRLRANTSTTPDVTRARISPPRARWLSIFRPLVRIRSRREETRGERTHVYASSALSLSLSLFLESERANARSLSLSLFDVVDRRERNISGLESRFFVK